MQNARLDEAQAGIKIARRNTNNLRYADDTTLMVESEEELKRTYILNKLVATQQKFYDMSVWFSDLRHNAYIITKCHL